MPRKRTSSNPDLLTRIEAPDSLAALEAALAERPAAPTRDALEAELLRVVDYRHADEWNRAVRICEALAIVGWGALEPVEAIRGKFFNGNPMTFFQNRYGELRFVDAVWSRRKDGLTMEPGRTSYHASPDRPAAPTVLWEHPVEEDVRDVALATQRNWIPKSPVRVFRRIANCHPRTKPLVASIDDVLAPRLLREMRPEAYGPGLQRIELACSFSYDDGPYNRCNYVVFDAPRALSKQELTRRLAAAHAAEAIARDRMFAVNEIALGRFVSATARYDVTVHFGAELAERTEAAQRGFVAEVLVRAVGRACEKLRRNVPGYELDAMAADFEGIVGDWAAREE